MHALSCSNQSLSKKKHVHHSLAGRGIYSDQLVESPAFVFASTPVRALYFGTLWFPYDRPLPSHNALHFPCKTAGSIVRDWTVEEAHTYACCGGLQCPLPPPRNADILRALLFERPVQVWWYNGSSNKTHSSSSSGEDWQLLTEPFVYYDSMSLTGILKRCVAAAVIFGLVLTVLGLVVHNTHVWSAKYPKCAMCVHAFALIVVVAFSAQSMLDFENPMYRVAAAHILFEALTSPLLVYTPSEKHHIGYRDRRCGSRLRRAAEWLYAVRVFVCLPVAVCGACDIMWQMVDAEFDLLIALSICVVIMSLMHSVAFVTGIHEIEAPLRLHDHSVVHKRSSEESVRIAEGMLVAVYGVGWVSKTDWSPTAYRLYTLQQFDRSIVLRDIGHVQYGKAHVERVFAMRSAACVLGQ